MKALVSEKLVDDATRGFPELFLQRRYEAQTFSNAVLLDGVKRRIVANSAWHLART